MWVINYLDDLDADFRVFYRIDNMLTQLDGPRFFRLAMRVGAYQGVISARLAEENPDYAAPVNRSTGGAPKQPQEVKRIEATPTALAIAAPGMFSFKKAKAVEE